MQLHACLLLFIITTDKTLASSRRHCGGNVSLGQEPAGHINLTLPRLFTDAGRLSETPPASLCTWRIGLPAGRTVLLKLESGSSASLRCSWNEAARVLDGEGTALLSGCDGNKATLSWTGAGHSSDSIQLTYYVQEDERNSSEDHASPHSGRDPAPWTQTGASFASAAPVGQELVRGAAGGRAPLSEGPEEWSSGRQSVSSPSSRDRGLPHPTSPVQRLTAAGKTDRGTLPFPEEEPNNRADTSGAAHLTDGPISPSKRTHPYFQYTFSADTLFHTSQSTQTETESSNKLPPTQKPHATASIFDTMLVTDRQEHKATWTSKLSVTTQEYPTVSSSAIPSPTSSHFELSSWTTWESETTQSPQGGPVSRAPGEKLSHSWRSQRSTDWLNSELASAVTSDPLKSPTQPQEGDSSSARTDTGPAASSTSSEGPGRTYSSAASIKGLGAAAGTVEAASLHPNISQNDPFASTASDVARQTSALESSDKFENTEALQTFTFSTRTQSDSPRSAEGGAQSTPWCTSSPFTPTSREETQETATHSAQRNLVDTYMTTNTVSSSPDITKVEDQTLAGPSSTPKAALTSGDAVQDSAATGSTVGTESLTPHPAYTLLRDRSPSPVPHLSTSASARSSTPSYAPQTDAAFSDGPHFSHTSLPSATTEPATNPSIARETTPIPSQTTTIKSPHAHQTQNIPPFPSSSTVQAARKKPQSSAATTQSPPFSQTTAMSDSGLEEVNVENEDKSWSPSSTTAGPLWRPPPWTTLHPSQENHRAPTSSILTYMPTWRSTTSQTPKFYIVPDQPAAIRVESIELLLQIIVEETRSAFASGLEEDTTAWVEPYLQRTPGFSRLLGVWSSGHAVQNLVEFKTSGALQWLSRTGPASLLERSGLAQAVREGRSFRSSKVTNVTLGGLQADVCDWLLQCEAGYKCVSQPGTSNYSCSSVCHFDFCHHHGICTHHPGQLPVCRCLVGEDFWFMGQRCDVKMTQARLVGTCLAVLLIVVTVIAVLAFVAVRRYRAVLIQAKVDQTRSSYRRFNHFDELSGRFWLRSWAGSADSLDNPAFTRSDELLHLRALDRPCCYHDDTLSLASTCPSHGARINTIYPHSSQYGWRGSEMSMGDGVLDSGKASDLSVCSWPVEPIQWTPFPILQQLASHRTPTVRVSRPRSYCEGMELVDLGKSWTA